MPHKKRGSAPGDDPILMPQPPEGDPATAFQMVNRYGTYEIQPTTDTENFFPSIGAGSVDTRSLHRLRQQTEVGTDATQDPERPRGRE